MEDELKMVRELKRINSLVDRLNALIREVLGSSRATQERPRKG